MKKPIIFLALLFAFQASFSQIAVIRDPDGTCNVREKPSGQSNVADVISNGKLVFCYEEEANGNWLNIEYKRGYEVHTGYVHKSRLFFLNTLPEFSKTLIGENALTLKSDSLEIVMKSGNFEAGVRKIKFDKNGEGRFLESIDGKAPFGVDGNLPTTEYKVFQVKSGSKIYTIQKESFQDTFEPAFDKTKAYLENSTNKIYVEAMNSDGAGSYIVVWTIQGGRILNRDTFIPF